MIYTNADLDALAEQIEPHVGVSRENTDGWTREQVLQRLRVVEPLWNSMTEIADSIERHRSEYESAYGVIQTKQIEKQARYLTRRIGFVVSYIKSRPIFPQK